MARRHKVAEFAGRVRWPFRESRVTTLAALVVGLLCEQKLGLAGVGVVIRDADGA